MAKDKRSRRDKLKDGILDNIHKRIEHLEAINKERQGEIDANLEMISILREQMAGIRDMCMRQDESYKKKKPDDKAT